MENVDEIILKNNILDFTIENEDRLNFFITYYNKFNIDKTLELLNKLCGIYQFSGIKILENFLFDLSLNQKIESCIIRLEASKSLFLFEEYIDEINQNDTDEIKNLKLEHNKKVIERNEKRKNQAFKSLNNVCSSNINTLPTPCRINAIHILMESQDIYKHDCDIYFRKIINDINIDCYYRYKTILDLENKKNTINFTNFYIKNACFDFLFNIKNSINYRILSAQYLLQNFKDLEDYQKRNIQQTILSFAQKTTINYNLRADSADLLLNLGSDEYKIFAKDIINLLGNIDGNVKTIYDNRQNVHSEPIEKSSLNILQILSNFPILKINNNEIDYSYVYNQINNILIEQKKQYHSLFIPDINSLKNYSSSINCKNCNSYIGYIYFNDIKCENCIKNNEQCFSKSINKNFCSDNCNIQFDKHSKIYLSLNRIELDRTLYLNNTLSKILIKLWSYIVSNKFKDQMILRLLEELEDMSGTCSSGFLSRLLNTISGFGDINIYISFEDQLIANFIGRLNAYAKKITDTDSIFYNERLYDVLEIILRDQNLFNNIINKNKKDIIDNYLLTNKEQKIYNAIEKFSENVINEMTIDSNKYNEKKHFLLFFISYLPKLRQELYEEFKDYIEDSIFDLNIRKAISTYEGLNDLI